jgi:two-component system, OmpR family, sensor kinase
MRQPRSIRFRLASVFLFLFVLVILLGLFSISRLSNFNLVSANVAEVWLPDIRVLGDLNNFTSDFRAIEGSNLLSSAPSEVTETEREMEELDRAIARAERSFERIQHDRVEDELYAQFKERWNNYRKTVNQMLTLSRANNKAEGIAIYRSSSRAAYNAASDTLGQLTDRAVVNAEAASSRLVKAYWQAFWLIGVGMVLAGVMVAAALLYISRSISAPLLHLAYRMHRLAANETDIDIPNTERRDEIGEMARAAVVFRKNAIELMRSHQVLAKQASMLKEQLAQEQRLALLQRNFVSMASHEFRTPLTIIDGHAQRMIKVKDRMARDEIGDRAGKVRGAVLRLTHLIDNLLESSRLVDGGTRVSLESADIDMAALLREVCQLHREMAPRSQIVERFATAPLRMVGDSKLLSQVFGNLLSNAVKYSPGGGSIYISAEVVSEEVVVAVVDHGIGIPESDLDRLFERYQRGSNVSGIVGTGVGLYLAKMIVDMHGGRIEVKSKEYAGSRFTVRFPTKPPPQIQPSSATRAASVSRQEVPHIDLSPHSLS